MVCWSQGARKEMGMAVRVGGRKAGKLAVDVLQRKNPDRKG